MGDAADNVSVEGSSLLFVGEDFAIEGACVVGLSDEVLVCRILRELLFRFCRVLLSKRLEQFSIDNEYFLSTKFVIKLINVGLTG